jgi:D-glycero-D-manno-heptose 1,7-bisphosphate phosphatase
MIHNLSPNNNYAISKLLILDRDGTLIRNVPYIYEKSKIEFNFGVIRGLKRMLNENFELVVCSNQSGIGRKKITVEQVDAINLEIRDQLQNEGISLSQFIYCPHVPAEGCICRKPNNGMIEKILDLKKVPRFSTFFIGDNLVDALAAEKSRIASFIIHDGDFSLFPVNSTKVDNFEEAVDRILIQN